MKALVYKDIGRVEVMDVPEPGIVEPDDAIISVSAAAICGSDLHLFRGRLPGMTEGTIIGHMLVGHVDQVGPAVTRVKPGDRVVVSFLIPCGECWWCAREEYNNCNNVSWRVLGYGMFLGDLNGCQAEKVRVPVANLTLLPIDAAGEGLPDEKAVFVGDSLATGYYAAELAQISPGDTVAVIGCGPIGIFTIQYCRLLKPGQILALDSVPSRLAMAEKLGAVPIDVSRQNPAIAVAGLTGERGADVAIDCVGSPQAFDSGFEMLRAGGHLVVVGVYVELEHPFALGEAWRKNLRITFAGVTPVMRFWDKVLDSVRTGAVDPAVIVSHVLPLDEGAEAYRMFEAREATQIILKP